MKELYNFIIFILGGLGKFLKIVLFKLGLWVPLVFSTLFLIVIAITKTPFESVAGLFWFGVILTALLSLVATVGFAIARGRKKKQDSRSTQSAVKPKDDEQAPSPAPQYAPYPGGYAVPNAYAVPPAFMPGYQPPYPQAPQNSGAVYPQAQQNGMAYQQPQQTAQEQSGYIPQQQTPPIQRPTYQAPESVGFNSSESDRPNFDGFTRRARFDEGFSAEEYACPQGRPPESFEGFSASPRRARISDEGISGFGFNAEPVETPRIFKTRKDPDILIYDYSDRVEFYRKTQSGLQFLYKEMK